VESSLGLSPGVSGVSRFFSRRPPLQQLGGTRDVRQRIGCTTLPFCRITLKGPKPFSPAYPRDPVTIAGHPRKRRPDLKLLQREVAEVPGVVRGTGMCWGTNRRPATSQAHSQDHRIPGIRSFTVTYQEPAGRKTAGHLASPKKRRASARASVRPPCPAGGEASAYNAR
jgi:hypothetical protein